MRIYLASSSRLWPMGKAYPYHLVSYAETFIEALTLKVADARAPKPTNIMLDSGGFGVWSRGLKITAEDYGEFIVRFREQWRTRTGDLQFMNLDVIGDQAATWKNYDHLSKIHPVLPIVTWGSEDAEVDRALDLAPYICVGGLVHRRPGERLWWLDRAFKRVWARAEATGTMPAVHILGVTSKALLLRYPAKSCDSSSWVAVARYGSKDALSGGRKIPLGRQDPAGHRAAIEWVLFKKIHETAALMRTVTRYWSSKGVTHGDETEAFTIDSANAAATAGHGQHRGGERAPTEPVEPEHDVGGAVPSDA